MQILSCCGPQTMWWCCQERVITYFIDSLNYFDEFVAMQNRIKEDWCWMKMVLADDDEDGWIFDAVKRHHENLQFTSYLLMSGIC